ncbi:MAG: hypothetical protein J6S78_00350 [Lachnospiraceae bacterium]|nr:hypothetical protein [Lachnospiraceae bacterium]
MDNDVTKRRVIGVVIIIGCFILLFAGGLILSKKLKNTGDDGEKSQMETEDDVGKAQTKNDADDRKKQKEADEKRLEELKLDPLGSYYLNTSPEKGLTVCVWKYVNGYENGEGQILCGLLPRQLDKIDYDPELYYDPEYTYDLGRMGLGLWGLPPEDMKIILSTFDLPKEKISVIAWHNLADATGFNKTPNYFEVSEVKEYLLGDK